MLTNTSRVIGVPSGLKLDFGRFEKSSLFLSRQAPRVQWFATWCACVWLLLWRGVPRYLNDHLWAEDGSVYLTRALNDGWKSLFESYAGYYQFLPQAIVSYLSEFDLSYLPESIFLVSVVIYATCASVFSRPCYRWLVPSDVVRTATSLALCLTPGLWETLGSMANIQWTLLLLGGLVACKNLDEELTPLDVAAVVLIGSCSGGACTLLLPFGVRVWLRDKRGVVRRDFCGQLCFWVLVAWTVANSLQVTKAVQKLPVDWMQLGRFFISTVLGRYVIQPTLGDAPATFYANEDWSMLPWALLITAVLIWPLWRKAKENPTFAAWIASNVAIYILAFLKRPVFHQQLLMISGIDRFAVPAGQCALIMWMACLSTYFGEMKKYKAAVALCFCFLSLHVYGASDRFYIEPYPGIISNTWMQTAAELKGAIRKREALTVLCRPNFPIRYEPSE